MPVSDMPEKVASMVAPSIVINQYNRSAFVNIRGVGIAQSAPTSSPGVAYYINGQLIPHEQFIGQSFYDIASVEVLRGPQGTLTGQNSTGGAIYVTTPEPLPPSHPLYSTPGCLILPHIGSATETARRRMAGLASANLLAGVRRQPLPHQVSTDPV